MADDAWRRLAEGLARQRLGPLEPHLKGVRRMVIVNSPGMAGVPIEALTDARDGTSRGELRSVGVDVRLPQHSGRAWPTGR